jgi:hypothetical protein
MPEEDMCEFLGRVEVSYKNRMIRAWLRDPERFDEYIMQLNEVVDLRSKLCKV